MQRLFESISRPGLMLLGLEMLSATLAMDRQRPFLQPNTNSWMKQSFLLAVVLVANLSVGNGQPFG